MSAFDWLTSIVGTPQGPTKSGSPMSDPLGMLLSTAGQVYGYNQANNAVRQGNVPTASEKAQNALYQAMLNPNNPQMQALMATNKAQNLSNFQMQLQEMQLADRRNEAMGRSSTFFTPERADESMSYLTSRGLPQLNAMAQQQALGQLGDAAKGYAGLQAGQSGRLATQTQQGVSNANVNSQIPTAILNALRGVSPSMPAGGGVAQTPMMSGYGPYSPQPMYGTPQAYGQQFNQMRY